MSQDFFEVAARLTRERTAFVTATVIATSGSTPQKAGAKLLVLVNGTLVGTIGGGAIEKQVVDAALLLHNSRQETRTIETHLTHDLGMCCGGKMTVFLEKQVPQSELIIFGAGHVAKALADVAAGIDFSVHVVDERSEWLTAERFPLAKRHLTAPDEFARTLKEHEKLFCCVTTHDHPLDQACVEHLLPKKLAYVGCIGSERKASKFRSRLEAAGLTQESINKLESPMGISIEAQSPEEIAISIAARLIQVRRALESTTHGL
jgi:xanthine dehydrogenase accessory factor